MASPRVRVSFLGRLPLDELAGVTYLLAELFDGGLGKRFAAKQCIDLFVECTDIGHIQTFLSHYFIENFIIK